MGNFEIFPSYFEKLFLNFMMNIVTTLRGIQCQLGHMWAVPNLTCRQAFMNCCCA